MLVLITVTSLLQAVVFPGTAQAQADRHRAGTFNMQGAPDRWQQGVYSAAKQVDVLALQEVPDAVPPDAELADGAYVHRLTTLAHGFTVERYRWVNCRPPGEPQSSPCIIYRVKTPTRRNRSLAIVVNQPTDAVRAVQVIPPQPVVPGGPVNNAAKPALGILLADGTWFYTLHAQNRPSRASQRNDVPNLISKISADAGSHWAAMGDFNRTPDSLDPLLADNPDLQIVRSGLFTYPVKSPKDEFDYMISNGVTDNQYTGFRLTYLDASDHYPVGFWTSAAPDGHEFRCDPIDAILKARRAACVPPKNPAIVSLGDSYISGEAGRWAGNADTGAHGSAWGTDRAADNCSKSEDECDHDLDTVYGPTSYAPGGTKCDRSDVAPINMTDTDGYPRVPPWRRFNLACSGATTNEITHPYADKGEDAQTNQLADIAKRYQVKMIVVSIGGNDLKFSDIVRSCVKRYVLRLAGCRGVWPDVDKDLVTVRQQVVTALRAVQQTMQTAGYQPKDYNLVVQSYPAPLPRSTDYRYKESGPRYSDGGCPFYDADTDWARQTLVGGLTRELRNAAATVGARFFDLGPAFEGHELCSNRADQASASDTLADPLPVQYAEWVRWIPYLLSSDLLWLSQGDQQEALHPNAYGQEALGECLSQLGGKLESGFGRPATDYTCRNTPVLGIDVEPTKLPTAVHTVG
ncbi:hypothetical protein AQI95_06380 [Streptomyces yokosukanensis]|uniref:SGNH hydrolase-type esterase domain-containing protein n=1 Tax=Streptomyces yokosukanensis TaxID=67386 RepID=A0A101PDF7_9ACTN|nr:hypothetical protein AQI95_06380 [Streptomyces yokosukanensis]